VKIPPDEYDAGKVACPICNMKLTPVYKEKAKAEEVYYGCGCEDCPHCDLGVPDSKCICGQHFFMIEGQKMNCPVCSKPLRKLAKEEADKLRGVVSRVKIKGDLIKRAGVKTEPVRKLHLYKEIRSFGKIAYDPELVIAEEEFISSLKALDKIKRGDISETKERARNLVESAKRKLLLLGLGEKQIKELEEQREVQKSLILPEEKMWVYGDVYEHELSWVKAGDKATVTASSFPGLTFDGVISSIDPVLDPKTRAVKFRMEVDNPELKLKPEMYVDVIIKSMYISPDGEHMVLAIPKDAVLSTGTRDIVWVDKKNSNYEGRRVRIGPEAVADVEGQAVKVYPVLSGVIERELVVKKANFLIDSQSQISGVAASAYGGALEGEKKKAAPVHQH